MPTKTQTSFAWQTKIPKDWVEDATWSLIAQIHASKGVPFKVEIIGSNIVMRVGTDTGEVAIYNKPMLKDEWIKFEVESYFSELDNGSIKVYINGMLEVDYKGPCYFSNLTSDTVRFKCGLYIAKESAVIKRTIEHRI